MNEWGFIGHDILWGLESPPQLINLKQGEAMSKRKGRAF